MAAHRNAQLRVLLPSGGSGALRAADHSDSGRTESHGRSDRVDQHDAVVDARGNDGRRGLSGRPLLAQADHHPVADRLVAHDRVHGLYRRIPRSALLPLDRDRRRRELLRPERLRAHRRSPQGDTFRRALHPPGGALCGAHGFGPRRGVGARTARHVAQRLHRVRRGRLRAGDLLHLGSEGQ